MHAARPGLHSLSFLLVMTIDTHLARMEVRELCTSVHITSRPFAHKKSFDLILEDSSTCAAHKRCQSLLCAESKN
eukprot:1159041-Pelagomonas_calceolata.AAC.13